MKNCKVITELISLGNEQKLGLNQRFAVQIHLLICPYCRAFNKNNRQIRQLMHTFKQQEDKE